jgi:hypothetical protein
MEINNIDRRTTWPRILSRNYSSTDGMYNVNILFSENQNLILWRAWLCPWTQPVPARRCAAPRGVHRATCSVNSPACIYSAMYSVINWYCLFQLLSLLPVHRGDPHMIRSLALLPFSGCCTRLRANNVKRRRLHCPSVGASLGIESTMRKAGMITHAFPGSIPLLAGPPPPPHNKVTGQSPGQVAGGGGGEACGGPAASLRYQSHQASGSTICFLPRAAVWVLGMHSHLQWNQVLLLAMSHYNTYIHMYMYMYA